MGLDSVSPLEGGGKGVQPPLCSEMEIVRSYLQLWHRCIDDSQTNGSQTGTDKQDWNLDVTTNWEILSTWKMLAIIKQTEALVDCIRRAQSHSGFRKPQGEQTIREVFNAAWPYSTLQDTFAWSGVTEGDAIRDSVLKSKPLRLLLSILRWLRWEEGHHPHAIPDNELVMKHRGDLTSREAMTLQLTAQQQGRTKLGPFYHLDWPLQENELKAGASRQRALKHGPSGRVYSQAPTIEDRKRSERLYKAVWSLLRRGSYMSLQQLLEIAGQQWLWAIIQGQNAFASPFALNSNDEVLSLVPPELFSDPTEGSPLEVFSDWVDRSVVEEQGYRIESMDSEFQAPTRSKSISSRVSVSRGCSEEANGRVGGPDVGGDPQMCFADGNCWRPLFQQLCGFIASDRQTAQPIIATTGRDTLQCMAPVVDVTIVGAHVLGQYERAIYGFLAGNFEAVAPVCHSWRDRLWARITEAKDALVRVLLLRQRSKLVNGRFMGELWGPHSWGESQLPMFQIDESLRPPKEFSSLEQQVLAWEEDPDRFADDLRKIFNEASTPPIPSDRGALTNIQLNLILSTIDPGALNRVFSDLVDTVLPASTSSSTSMAEGVTVKLKEFSAHLAIAHKEMLGISAKLDPNPIRRPESTEAANKLIMLHIEVLLSELGTNSAVSSVSAPSPWLLLLEHVTYLSQQAKLEALSRLVWWNFPTFGQTGWENKLMACSSDVVSRFPQQALLLVQRIADVAWRMVAPFTDEAEWQSHVMARPEIRQLDIDCQEIGLQATLITMKQTVLQFAVTCISCIYRCVITCNAGPTRQHSKQSSTLAVVECLNSARSGKPINFGSSHESIDNVKEVLMMKKSEMRSLAGRSVDLAELLTSLICVQSVNFLILLSLRTLLVSIEPRRDDLNDDIRVEQQSQSTQHGEGSNASILGTPLSASILTSATEITCGTAYDNLYLPAMSMLRKAMEKSGVFDEIHVRSVSGHIAENEISELMTNEECHEFSDVLSELNEDLFLRFSATEPLPRDQSLTRSNLDGAVETVSVIVPIDTLQQFSSLLTAVDIMKMTHVWVWSVEELAVAVKLQDPYVAQKMESCFKSQRNVSSFIVEWAHTQRLRFFPGLVNSNRDLLTLTDILGTPSCLVDDADAIDGKHSFTALRSETLIGVLEFIVGRLVASARLLQTNHIKAERVAGGDTVRDEDCVVAACLKALQEATQTVLVSMGGSPWICTTLNSNGLIDAHWLMARAFLWLGS
eukprot:GHVN01001403.1.p1 GENE.GHVN01001403.1~~GHVN01001403.1.p1  ORF type:complete len:1242 (-),score=138.54 GHVN01001403.1:3165-6890(-)